MVQVGVVCNMTIRRSTWSTKTHPDPRVIKHIINLDIINLDIINLDMIDWLEAVRLICSKPLKQPWNTDNNCAIHTYSHYIYVFTIPLNLY